MSKTRRDVDRLHDMLEAIDAIERHRVASFDEFFADEVLRFFVLKQIEIIGEAAYKCSPALKAAHPEIPWRAIEATRHIAVHEYFQVAWDKIWNVAADHLGALRTHVHATLREIEPSTQLS